MAYKIRCPSCGKSMRLPEGDAGLPVVCLACGTKFEAPSPVDQDAPPTNVTEVTKPVAALLDSGPLAEEAVVGPQDAPPVRERPEGRRFSWAWVGLAAGVLLVLGIVVSFVIVRGGKRAGADELSRMLADAQTLIGEGKSREAYQLLRELDARATEIGIDHPDVKSVAEDARFEQEQLQALMLAQRPPTPPAPPPVAPAPAPREAQVADLSSDAPTTSPAESPDTRPSVSQGVADADPIMTDKPVTQPADGGQAPLPRESPMKVASTTKPATKPTTSTAVKWRRPELQPQPEPVTGITDAQIGDAIQRGVNSLVPQFRNATGQLAGVDRGGMDEGYYCGLNALCVYALLQSGQAIPDERLNVRGPFMASLIDGMKRLPANTGKVTYARAIRATALALYNRKEDRSALAADVLYLRQTHSNGAYSYVGTRNGSSLSGSGHWDNSNSQYGLLGVWSGAEVDIEVPGDYWAAVHKHWSTSQAGDGTWGYAGVGTGSGTISMNAAGTASLFVAEDYLYASRFGARVGREPFGPPLKKALDWWETKGDFTSPTTSWWGYTLYGIERVGLASGFKYFGKHDWYRELAREIVSRQLKDGTWGDRVDTAYALLFLARGRHPILMNKLRFDRGGENGDQPAFWGNRPRDAANLARYAGRQLERPLNWQVVTLDREWHDWLDSPILSIASHRTPYFRDRDIEQFRQYVEAGGMLFLQADGDSAEFDTFAKSFAKRVFPEQALTDVPPGHVLFDVLYKIDPAPTLKIVSNGSRVLLLYSPKDITRSWQVREERAKPNLFKFGVNLFVYAAGKRELRNRLSSPYVSPLLTAAPLGNVKVARLKYDGAWDPEPGAWRRFANWFSRQTGTGVDLQTVPIESLRPGVAPVVHLTGVRAVTLSPTHLKAISAYVEAGGVLLVDSMGEMGDTTAFADSIRAALSAAFPDKTLQSVQRNHPMLNAGPPGMEDLTRPKLRPFVVERSAASGSLQYLRSGKGAVVFSNVDVTSGLLGTETWGIFGYDPAYAQSLVKNIVFWAIDGRAE